MRGAVCMIPLHLHGGQIHIRPGTGPPLSISCAARDESDRAAQAQHAARRSGGRARVAPRTRGGTALHCSRRGSQLLPAPRPAAATPCKDARAAHMQAAPLEASAPGARRRAAGAGGRSRRGPPGQRRAGGCSEGGAAQGPAARGRGAAVRLRARARARGRGTNVGEGRVVVQPRRGPPLRAAGAGRA
ncbi:MAG: hypothetical protein J3K34DRAFT_429958 [Monoraphidium minutum]|nr:MAG: hypothetical protein J3K34DRAFT_429958 [Monoraphidium minutum]